MANNPIDHSVISGLQDTIGTEFVSELITTFLEEAPDMLHDLKSAAASCDQDRFRRAAHSIKSNAAIFGALDLEEIARRMEATDSKLEAELNRVEFFMIDREFERTAAALGDIIDE